MIRKGSIGRRLESLEDGRVRQFDAAAEAAQHGRLLWTVDGTRCYVRQDAEVFALTLVGTGRPSLRYEFIGVPLEAL